MAEVKRLERLANEWFEFFDSLEKSEKDVTVVCGSKKEADTFRMKFYSARQLLLKEYGQAAYEHDYGFLDKWMVLIEGDDKNIIIFTHNSRSATSKLLKVATKQALENQNEKQ